MRLRRYPFPRRLEEILCFLTLGVLLPIIYLYGILVLLPTIHEPGSLLYNITIVLGTFMVLNIEGNLIACMIIETSVDPYRIEVGTYGAEDYVGWKHCAQCDRLAPPRSWHCKLCGVCILRRDHHCMFSGYCIGHQNQRYFMCLLFYLMFASVYYFLYCSIYIWRQGTHLLYINLLGNSRDLVFQVFCILNMILLILVLVALNYYVPKLMRGQVSAESKKKLYFYDNGVKNNLKTVFGQNMLVSWLSPLIKSQLPEDGYIWRNKTKPELKLIEVL